MKQSQEVISVDAKHGEIVLTQIDTCLADIRSAVKKAETTFVNLAMLLSEAKRSALWTLRGYESEQEWIDAIFPGSQAQYYDLIRIGTHLASYDQKLLEDIGRTKCTQLVRLHIHYSGSVPDEWIEKARSTDTIKFAKMVRSHLEERSGKKKETAIKDEMMTFRIFGDGIHIVHSAFERLAQELGSEKSMGYRLEMLCADYLSGATDDGSPRITDNNSFILRIIRNLIERLDFTQDGISDRLIGTVAHAIEAAREKETDKTQ